MTQKQPLWPPTIDPSTDILALSLNNPLYEAAYPFSFVRLKAAGREEGLTVKTHEMTMIEPQWRDQWVREHIRRHNPKLLLFLVRDLVVPAEDFLADRVEQTTAYVRKAITAARESFDGLIGLFGSGVQAAAGALLDNLQADFAFADDGRTLTGNFNRFMDGDRDLDNLIYRDGGQTVENPRVFHPPADYGHYDRFILGDIIAHYGRLATFGDKNLRIHHRGTPNILGLDFSRRQHLLPRHTNPSIVVEVATGCPHACRFCVEPLRSGAAIQTRDLTCVEADIRRAAELGLRHFWLEAPELNSRDNRLLDELAELMLRVAEDFTGKPFLWRGTHLPISDTDLLAKLYRSGFQSTSFEVHSLDDHHLRIAGLPVTAEQIIAGHKADADIRRENDLEPLPFVFSIADPDSGTQDLAHTIARFNQADLASYTSGTWLISAHQIRAELGDRYPEAEPGRHADPLQPRFWFNPTFREPFADGEAYLRHYQRLTKAFLCEANPAGQAWYRFLGRHICPDQLAEYLEDWSEADLEAIWSSSSFGNYPEPLGETLKTWITDGSAQTLTQLFAAAGPGQAKTSALVHLLLRTLFHHQHQQFQPILQAQGLSLNADGTLTSSPYQLLQTLHRNHQQGIQYFGLGQDKIAKLLAAYLLAQHQIPSDPQLTRDLLPTHPQPQPVS